MNGETPVLMLHPDPKRTIGWRMTLVGKALPHGRDSVVDADQPRQIPRID